MAARLSRRKIARYYASALVEGAGADKLALGLAAYLVESRRTKELDLIVRDITYYLSLDGVVSASVDSAHKLSDVTKQAITDLIKDHTKAQTIQLTENIKPDILGGVLLKLPGYELDTTIAKRLTLLKTNYKK